MNESKYSNSNYTQSIGTHYYNSLRYVWILRYACIHDNRKINIESCIIIMQLSRYV